MEEIMKVIRSLMVILLIFAFATSCVKSSNNSPEKAKEVMEKSFKKYEGLVDKSGKNFNSVAIKAAIKGNGELPAGGTDSKMPINIDAVVELYFVKPGNIYIDISGNIGNAKIIASDKEKNMATLILPGMKQFAIIDLPKQIIQETQEKKPNEPDRSEKFFQTTVLEYLGTEKTKSGKAHKILVKNKDPKDTSTITAYILDRKWDPARFDINNPDGGAIVIDFDKLELNAKVPDSRFVPDTAGYTKVNNQQITAAIMMQLMSSMMQQKPQQ
jgi:outer membrane lipoprotein-sorting protein